MNKLSQNLNLANKNVLLRVDFDVPINDDGSIDEPFRIERQRAMLDWLVEKGAQVVMVAHSSKLETFKDFVSKLDIFFDKKINFLSDYSEIKPYLQNYQGPALLDNTRRNKGEELNDDEFAKNISAGFDIYINNAFAVCHRSHASVSAVTKYLPAYAGFLVEEEVTQLREVLSRPTDGKIIIMGGAKASTKIPVIKSFIDKAENILIGGVIANDFLKLRGDDMGQAKVDDNLEVLFEGLNTASDKIILPTDFNPFENKFLDIGPESVARFNGIIEKASMIIWNGPMGMFEDERFANGTNAIAEAVTGSKAFKVLGGGDTISAVNKFGLLDKFDFVSTGGGAMLAFLAGDRMPGLEALGYYE